MKKHVTLDDELGLAGHRLCMVRVHRLAEQKQEGKSVKKSHKPFV